MPSNTVLNSGSAVGAAQILIWSYSCVFLPPMSTIIRTSVFSFVGALNVFLYIPHTWSLPSWSCGFNLLLILLVGKFWVIFISHTAHGFQLWFYFHLCMWVIHWGLLLRLPWSCINTPVFPPSSIIVLSFAWFYIYLSAGRYSCPLSDGVLHELLCLKVYCCCIRGEWCTPRPPTLLPSCPLLTSFNIQRNSRKGRWYISYPAYLKSIIV